MSIPDSVFAILSPLVQRFEGCLLKAYRDAAGVWTIGYGHTPAAEGDQWTQSQAQSALETDLAVHYGELLSLSPGLADESASRQAALTDFVYNMGSGNYRSSTLRAAVDCQSWPAVKLQLAKWDHAGGKVLPGLAARRQAEIDLIDA